MTFSWPVFIIGLILGVLQLGVGVIIGRTLPVRGQGGDSDESSDDKTTRLARRLRGLMTALSDDVGRHQVRIERMTKDISTLQLGNTPELIERLMRNVAQVTQANRELQSRLADAEGLLTEEAARIETTLGVAPVERPSPPDNDFEAIARDLRDRLAQVTAEA